MYQAPRRQLVGRDVMTGEERLLGRCDPTAICRPRALPGRAVARDPRRRLDRPATRGEAPRDLGSPTWGSSYDVSWSPDGELARGHRHRGASAARERRVVTQDPGPLDPGTVRPRRRLVARRLVARVHRGTTARGRRELPPVVVRAPSRAPRRTRRRGLAGLGDCRCAGVSPPSFAWAPDGSVIAYTRVAGPLNADARRRSPRDPAGRHGTGTPQLRHRREPGLAADPVGLTWLVADHVLAARVDHDPAVRTGRVEVLGVAVSVGPAQPVPSHDPHHGMRPGAPGHQRVGVALPPRVRHQAGGRAVGVLPGVDVERPPVGVRGADARVG